MKEYNIGKIRNVSIISHGGAGKTSLTEAVLYNTGKITRLGKTEDGSTTTDFDPEEIKRKMSINTALAPCEWSDHKINFLDTPGYSDFVAEVLSSLEVADCALLVVCAASGVEVETEKVWQYTKNSHLPSLAFVNKMDRENADFFATLKAMQKSFGLGVVPITLPIGAVETFQGFVDLISRHAYQSMDGQISKISIPTDLADQVDEFRLMLMESVAEADDELLAKYLEGEELTEEEIRHGLMLGVHSGKITPVLCGSATKNIGISHLLDCLIACAPAPDIRQEITGFNPQDQAPLIRPISSDQPFSAIVFKTTADPYVGKISYFKVLSGKLKSDMPIYNVSKDKLEKINQIFTLRGKQQENLASLCAGDIGAVAKLQFTGTGDTLTEKEKPVLYTHLTYPKPMFTIALQPKSKGDEDKLGGGLARMLEEDPTLKVQKNLETGQLLVSGMGEMHVDIMIERLKRKFGIDVTLSTPKVPYRETIRCNVKVEGKHKKQTGGHGQYGHVWLRLEPLATGSGFEFTEEIFGGSVPRQFIPAVEKGLREAMQTGVLAGYPMVDMKAVLYDGSFHPVDSSEMSFKLASTLALRKGALQAQPILLEPIMNVEVHAPENYMGTIIGDFNSKRGRIMGMEPLENNRGVVKAQVPLAEMYRYPIDLRSLTQGKGDFDMDFSHYEEVPPRIADSIITQANAQKEKAQ